MKILLEVNDDKVSFFMELIKGFSFIKLKKVDTKKEELLDEIEEAIDNLHKVKSGELKAKSAKELLDEL